MNSIHNSEQNQEKNSIRRTKVQQLADQKALTNHLIRNFCDESKLTFNKIKTTIYPNSSITDRTIREDLSAVSAYAKERRYYTLQQLEKLKKLLQELEIALESLQLYAPFMDAKGFLFNKNHTELETANLYTVILRADSPLTAHQFYKLIEHYFNLFEIPLSDIFYTTRLNNQFVELKFIDKHKCELFVDLIYNLKYLDFGLYALDEDLKKRLGLSYVALLVTE